MELTQIAELVDKFGPIPLLIYLIWKQQSLKTQVGRHLLREVRELKKEVMALPCKKDDFCPPAEGPAKKAVGMVLSALFALQISTGCDPAATYSLYTTDDPLDCSVQTISGGDVESGINALARVFGKGGCSGALVSSNAILTAKHCVSGATTVEVWGATYAILHIIEHPTEDLAICILDRSAFYWTGKPIKPLQVYIGPLDVGDKIKIAGWGMRTQGMPDIKYPSGGSQIVSEVDEGHIHYVGQPGLCDGDSGGPTLYGTCLAGIHEARIGECGDESVDVRLAKYGDWLREML